MTDEQKVKEVYPDMHYQEVSSTLWKEKAPHGSTLIGFGRTEKDAIANAASRLPKALVCGCVGECKGHNRVEPKAGATAAAPHTFEEWWQAYRPQFDTYSAVGWEGVARASWNAAKSSSPAIKIRKFVSSGGTTGINDYEMSDGSIQAIRASEIKEGDWEIASPPVVAGGESETLSRVIEVLERAARFIAKVDDLHQTIYSNGINEDCEEAITLLQPLIKDVREKE